MEWIKVNVAGVPKMLNMSQYKELAADPGDATKCILVHNDTSTITIDADFENAVIYFRPLLFKEDALTNPL